MRAKFTLSVVAAAASLAQSPAPRPAFQEFEVATVKPVPPDGPQRGRYFRMQSAHRFYATNYSLKVLISLAYNLTPGAVSGGPSWVDTDRYEIVAETPNSVRPALDEQMAMLRKLLTDRFALSFHREPKEFSIYALTVAKNGPKLKSDTESLDVSPEGPPPLVITISPGDAQMPGKNTTLSEFASVLQRAAVGRPVIDRTGLTGRFDFDLEWTPDETQFDGLVPKADRPDAKPDLITAIQQQMGLRLEAAKGMIDTIVIDHAEKPTDN